MSSHAERPLQGIETPSSKVDPSRSVVKTRDTSYTLAAFPNATLLLMMSRIEGFLSQPFHAGDLTIMSTSWLSFSSRMECGRKMPVPGAWVRDVEKHVLIMWRPRGEYERWS